MHIPRVQYHHPPFPPPSTIIPSSLSRVPSTPFPLPSTIAHLPSSPEYHHTFLYIYSAPQRRSCSNMSNSSAVYNGCCLYTTLTVIKATTER